MALHELLTARKTDLVEHWTAVVRSQVGDIAPVELVDRIPFFVDEVIRALRPGVLPLSNLGSVNAEEHGTQRLRLGFDIGEVVREYGWLHVCILDLAAEAGMPVTEAEGRTLARILSEGTSDAVSQYAAQRDAELARQASEHISFVAHELRNPLASAKMAFVALRKQQLREATRSTNALERALFRLGTIIDNTLAHAWLKVGAAVRGERVDLRALLAEIEADTAIETEGKGQTLTVAAEPIVLFADPRLIGSAISNLIINALKFTRPGGAVSVRARALDGRVLIEVEDGCGGLPPGKTEQLFSPFTQGAADRSGYGLGLAIARQAAESHNGTIKVRNLPGKGCVFTIDLPALSG